MTYIYKKFLNGLDNTYSIGRFSVEGGQVWWFSEDDGNRHYQEYLAWLAEGNEPEVVES